ncbi:hypothetical protein BJ878DRAFT_415468, partial [Calycina marina]
RKGGLDEAPRAPKKLSSRSSEEEIAHTLSIMIHTNQLEGEMKATSSYGKLFEGVERRRTEIIVLIYLMNFIIGFMGIPGTMNRPSLAYAMGSILLVQYVVYFITMVTEIPSGMHRAKNVVFARAV